MLTNLQQHAKMAYMLKETLKKIGLTEKEVDVYSAVLEHGKLSYTDISKKTGLNRTTVYSVAKELLSRGVLQEDLATPVKALFASSPEALSILTIHEETLLKEKKRLVAEAINDIRSLPPVSHYVAPVVTLIPEQRIAQYLRERNDDWNTGVLVLDKTWWGFQDVSFVSKYGDWIEWYWANAPKDISLKLFSNDAAIERMTQARTPSRREIRYWKGEQAFTGTLWVIGDTVININTRQTPFTLIETHDRILAQNLRTVFSKLWGSN